MDIAGDRVVIRLADWFAPQNTANIRALVRAGYFDGGVINRSQENYVVQWAGRPGADRGTARETVRGELGVDPSLHRRAFAPIPFGDPYAPSVGTVDGFPVAKDGESLWMTHCYGMVGVGRGDEIDGADGSELYVVIGQAPRHLDRNITLVGRLVEGMEHLTTLPRGTGPLGFYVTDGKKPPITAIRNGTDVPAAEQVSLEIMDMTTAMGREWVQARANRTRDGWFSYSHGAIDLCNLPVPVREAPEQD
ncbi:MAG: peptidylprolyl isomerase [Pacificimonas sp.]|jgi:peptidylprolyl isomerase|nr:peptidylprolyl isomerase [Pacificimonas sp.]